MQGTQKKPGGRRIAGMLVALGLWAAQAHAAGPAIEEVEKLMELSGLNKHIQQLPAAIALGFDRQKGKLKQARADLVRQELIASYQAQKMADIVKTKLRDGWKKEAMDLEREWLSSPLGNKLMAMQSEGNRAETEGKLRAFAAGLDKTPPDAERVEVIARMIHFAGLNESALDDNVMAVMTAAMIGVNAGQQPEQQLTPGQIAGVIVEARKNYAEPLRNEILLRSLYTYRNASQSDLESYATFLESPAAKYFNGLVAKSMREAIQAANADFANRLQAIAEKLAGIGA